MSLASFFASIFSKKNKQTKFPHVVVGQIVAIEPHPNADRLQLTTVNVGHHLRIVCGAANIAVGQLVPVALVGAALPNGLVIQQAAIRGVDSEGMLCAQDELGLGTDHSGIFVLSQGAIGDPIDEYLTN